MLPLSPTYTLLLGLNKTYTPEDSGAFARTLLRVNGSPWLPFQGIDFLDPGN